MDADTDQIVTRLMLLEHVKPEDLRQLGYDAAELIKRLRAELSRKAPPPQVIHIGPHSA